MALFASGNKYRKNYPHMSYKNLASRSLTLPMPSLPSLRQNKQTKKELHICWPQWKRMFQSVLHVLGLAIMQLHNGRMIPLFVPVWTLGQSFVQVNLKGWEPRSHTGESTTYLKEKDQEPWPSVAQTTPDYPFLNCKAPQKRWKYHCIPVANSSIQWEHFWNCPRTAMVAGMSSHSCNRSKGKE